MRERKKECIYKRKREIEQEKSVRVKVCMKEEYERKTNRIKEKKNITYKKRVCLLEKKRNWARK